MGQHQSSQQDRFRALLISPVYQGSSNYLACTVNDAKEWYDILTLHARVPTKHIRWLSDSPNFPQINRQSNTSDILNELDSLQSWANANKSKNPFIFIAYSGHGTQQRDDNDDEEDGKDEGWVAQDLGFIRDDYLNQKFLAKLPKQCRVIAINDACYNGTVWDTPYQAMFDSHDKIQVKHAKSRALVADKQLTQESPSRHSQRPSRKLLLVLLLLLVFRNPLFLLLLLMPRRRPVAFSEGALDPIKKARYSSGVKSDHERTIPPNEYRPVECTFTALSSSNDKQVSYEGAKNGFFSHQVHCIVRSELVPLLPKSESFEHLQKLWTRTGHSLLQQIGSTLHKWGIPQNPIWQVISGTQTDQTTPFLL